MRSFSEETEQTCSAALLRRSLAQHEGNVYSDEREDGGDSSFSPIDEASCLLSDPPSQTSTVAGSVSDQSFDTNSLVVLAVDCRTDEDVPSTVDEPQDQSFICESSIGSDAEVIDEMLDNECDVIANGKGSSFLLFRMSYLFVTLVVMLADGLQGTIWCSEKLFSIYL